MPNIHSSVATCRRCDLLIAESVQDTCIICEVKFCPECAVPTRDPDVQVCSDPCAARLNDLIKKLQHRERKGA